MTPAELRSVGEALRGPCWKRAIARDLGTSERMVQFWLSGERAIPDHIPGELLEMTNRHLTKLARVRDRLTTQQTPLPTHS